MYKHRCKEMGLEQNVLIENSPSVFPLEMIRGSGYVKWQRCT